ncbi:MAG: glycosyltransferase family 39 protein [Candidatus Omnitrophota bacterium]
MVKIKKGHIFLITILALGFILRIWGINFGLPYQYHQDEPMAINHAISYGSGDFNPHYFQLPPLIGYILFFLYAIFYLLGNLFNYFKDSDSFLTLFLQNPTAFYLIARVFLGLIPGCISIFLTFKVTQIISNKKSGYLAALFLAVSFLHVRDCHYAYHDVGLILFLLLAFLFSFKYLSTDKLSNMIWAGVFAGFATGFKYNGVLIIAPILLGPWLYKKDKTMFIGGTLRVNFTFLIFFALSYALSNPYSILDIKTFLASVFSESKAHVYMGWLYHISYSAFEGMGLFMAIISIAGFIIFLFSKDVRRKLIALFILLSYLSIVFFGQRHERYILPILPFLIIAASICIVDFFNKFLQKPWKKYFFILTVSILIAPPLIKSVYSDILFSRKDTRTQATEWIEDNLPQGSAIALDYHFFSPRLLQSPQQIREKINFLENKNEFGGRMRKAKILKVLSEREKSYNIFFLGNDKEKKFIFSSSPQLPFELDKLYENKIAYVIIHLDYPSQNYPNSNFKNSLIKKAELIKVFNPYKTQNIDLKHRFSTTAAPFSNKEIFGRNNNGPILLIYRLK